MLSPAIGKEPCNTVPNPYEEDNIDDLLAFSPEKNEDAEAEMNERSDRSAAQQIHSPPRGSSPTNFPESKALPSTGNDETKDNQEAEEAREDLSQVSSVQSL